MKELSDSKTVQIIFDKSIFVSSNSLNNANNDSSTDLASKLNTVDIQQN